MLYYTLRTSMRKKMRTALLIKPIWGFSQSWDRLFTVTRGTQEKRPETLTVQEMLCLLLVPSQSSDG